MVMDFKDFYWMHRTAFLAGGGVVAALLVSQTAMVVCIMWRLRELSHMRERLSRLADGLALLTDTTEAGLAAMAREIQQPAGRRVAAPRTESRASVNKRVVTAARKGADLTHIAQHEALSESEVRLHLKLAEARLRESQLAAAR
jgi:hypothetical protein